MYDVVATCGFGLESALSFEIKRLGVSDVAVSDGRINYRADENGVARSNMFLRTAERVLIVVGSFDAATFDELFDNTKKLPWGELIDRTDAFPVKGYSMSSTLSSVPACQSIVKKAVVDKLKESHGTQFLTEKGGVEKKIRFSIVKDRCTVMLDTSGDGLHKRGYRPLLNEAPIRETLAAGIADLARVFPESRAADPFCGSGTLVIESALRARSIAPGINRRFAGESYGFLKDAFALARAEARDNVKRDAPFEGRGSDIDPGAVETAKANAKRAGVEDCVSFSQCDALDFSPSEDEIILANPPYGERLMSDGGVDELYRDFGRALSGKRYKGLYIISGCADFEHSFGKKATRRRKLYNGMLPCQLYMYF